MGGSDTRIPLDDGVKEATDDVSDEVSQLVGRFKQDKKDSGEELELYKSWMPDEEQYQGKTRIQWEQAHALAGMRQLAHVFEMLGIEIDGLEEFLIALVKDYEQYQTSVGGVSREEQVRVLMAKAGVHADMEEAGRGLISRALAGENDGDD